VPPGSIRSARNRKCKLSAILPLLLVGVAFAVAARFEQRIPTRLRVYRFHAIAYPALTVLGLAAAAVMRLSSGVDWLINDAAVYLELLFGISGVVVCLVLAPVVWWLERRPGLTNAWRIGRMMVSTLTLVPYVLVAGVLLFYRD